MTVSSQQVARKETRGRALATVAPKAIKQTKQRKAPKTGRFMLKFWLDTNKEWENELNEYIKVLKTQRMFAHSIRAATALFKSLAEHRLDLLFEFFPWIKEYFEEMQRKMLAEQMEVIIQRLNQLEAQKATAPSSSPKQIAAPSFALPVFEMDDEPTVIIRSSGNTDSSMNFVTALKNMQ